MRRQHRPVLLAGILALTLLAAAIPIRTGLAMAAEPAEDDTGDLGIAHAACSFFGDHREDFWKSGLGAQLKQMTASSELTAQVVAALPSNVVAPRTRSRASGKLNQGGDDSIDDFIFGRLSSFGIPPAQDASDVEFLRRVSLDLTGRIPTQDEVVQFMASTDPQKRNAKVAELLETSQWADRWAMFFGDLYRNTIFTAQVNRYADGRDAFHLFILDSLNQNKPYDQMVREVLAATGTGDGRSYPDEYATYDQFVDVTGDYQNNPVTPTAASYIVGGLTTGGPPQDTYDTLAAITARNLLGVTHMDCILCHDGRNHLDSLSVWGADAKRSDGWGMAAFFAKTRLSRPRRLPPPPEGQPPLRPRYWVVSEAPNNEYVLNTTTGNRPTREASDNGGQPLAAAVYPFGGGTPNPGESRREALGRLLTADRQFARAAVNYIWREFFGRGIVEPPDQFDPARLDPASPPPEPWTIQPSHPELLEYLTSEFISQNFDLKWLMAEIANSDAYQLSSRYEGAWSPTYEEYFARHQARRLSAEELHDALVISSGIGVGYPISPTIGVVAYAMQFPDVQLLPRVGRRDSDTFIGSVPSFLDAFFRGDREQTPRSSEGSILQALQLMNSPLVLARVDSRNATGALVQIVQQPDDVAVQLLYLRVLSRPPTPEELNAGVEALSSGDRTAKAEDLMWSLYNKIDFLFNY